MAQCLARVENLSVRYGQLEAVKGVSFELNAGEIFAVIGPNGSGKTSAVECLEGLRRPSGGSVEVFGCDPRSERTRIYEKLGVQLQTAEYPAKIRVEELCRLFSAFYREPADWRRLLSKLGLWERRRAVVKKLSGGERQRLSILLALLPKPKLLILDELTTGLDPEVRSGMWESLRRIRGAGTGVLLVSHSMEEVEALADRLLYLVRGEQRFLGTQEEFRAFARQEIPPERWSEGLSLDALYLRLSPESNILSVEDVL